MALDTLKKELQDFNTNDFCNDFFWGLTSFDSDKDTKRDAGFISNIINEGVSAEINTIDLNLDNYKKDILSLKELGITYFRFSLSWSKILPEGIGFVNETAIDFYHEILDYCKANEIEPFVTLYDSCLPEKLEKIGGWTNREILNWFENYVFTCVHAFKDKVNYWVVLNEPSVFTGVGSFLGMQTKVKNTLNNFLPTLHHALLCQSIGFKTIKNNCPQAQVGTFFCCHYITPKSFSEKDLKAAERIDALLNRTFLEPSLGLGYPIQILPFLRHILKYHISGDDILLKVDFDFIGLHNCASEMVSHDLFAPFINSKIVRQDRLIKNNYTLDFETYAELIYCIIKKYSKYKGVKKIFIIENATSFFEEIDLLNTQDSIKTIQIKFFLQKILNAKNSGGKLDGYFISSINKILLQ